MKFKDIYLIASPNIYSRTQCIATMTISLLENEKNTIVNALHINKETANSFFAKESDVILFSHAFEEILIQIFAKHDPEHIVSNTFATVGIRIIDTSHQFDIRNSCWLNQEDMETLQKEHGTIRVPLAIEKYSLPIEEYDTPYLYDLILTW